MSPLLLPAVASIVLQGDAIPLVGAVTAIGAVAIDDAGRCVVYAETDYPLPLQDEVLLRDGVVLVREDDALPTPPGARADSLAVLAADASGDLVLTWRLDGDDLGTNDRGVYWGGTIVLQKGSVCSAAELTPGTEYVEFDGAKPAPHASRILVVATVDDPAIPTALDRALVTVLHDGAGGLVSEHVVVAEGDTIPGTGEPLQDLGRGAHESAIDDDGHVLYYADLSGDVQLDGCVCLDEAVLAREGSPSPIAGRSYEFLVGRGKDLGGGRWIFKANLGGDTFDDEILVRDGAALAREGEALPDFAPFALTSFGAAAGPVWLDDSGRAFWFGECDDPDTTHDGALFCDRTILLREGEVEADGIPIVAIDSGPGAFAVSADGSRLVFRGRLADDRLGVFFADLGAAVDVPPGRPDVPSGPAQGPIRISASPNPFTEAVRLETSTPVGASGRLAIHDVGGRLLRETRVPGRSGGAAVTWDGRDGAGRPLPAGVYVVRLEAGGRAVARKVVLRR